MVLKATTPTLNVNCSGVDFAVLTFTPYRSMFVNCAFIISDCKPLYDAKVMFSAFLSFCPQGESKIEICLECGGKYFGTCKLPL